MSEKTMTLVDVSPPGAGEPPKELPPLTAAEQDTVRELVRQARASGTALSGPGGLLKQLTKMVVEAALDEEMSEHLGYDKHAPQGRNRGNSRNGKRTKTVVTDNAGPVEIGVPRDRDGTFEPVIVPKRARRLSDLDAVVLSLSAKGLITGDISAHFADVYGANVSKDTVTRDYRPGHRGDGRMVGSPVGSRLCGGVHRRDHGEGPRRAGPQPAGVRGDRGRPPDTRTFWACWAGDGDGESAKFWFAVLTDLKARGVKDVFFVVCDGLKGLQGAVDALVRHLQRPAMT